MNLFAFHKDPALNVEYHPGGDVIHRKSDLSSMSDQDLVLKYQASGDQSLLAELFNRYTHLIYGVCMKYLKSEEDCKDAVMEVFEHLVGSLLRHEVGSFKSWIYSVTRNHCLMLIRHDRARPLIIAEPQHEIEKRKRFVESDPLKHLIEETAHTERSMVLRDALSRLKPDQRRCLELFYFEGHSYREIRVLTGFSAKQVKSHLQNGRRNLKRLLEAEKEHHEPDD